MQGRNKQFGIRNSELKRILTAPTTGKALVVFNQRRVQALADCNSEFRIHNSELFFDACAVPNVFDVFGDDQALGSVLEIGKFPIQPSVVHLRSA